MKTVTGACKFCGQIATFEVPDSWEESLKAIDEEATKRCKCEESRHYTARQNAQYRAEKYIDKCFNNDAIADVAKRAIPLIMDTEIESLTIDAGLGVKLTLKSSTKCYIKAKYTETKATTLEE